MKHKQDEEAWEPEFPGQHHDEVIELVFRQHPIVMRKALLYGLLIAAVGEMPLLFLGPEFFNLSFKILGLGWLIAILSLAYRWIGYHYSCYILTDTRLIDIHQKGFFNRQVNEVGLNKVQSINYHIKGITAVTFRFGDITVQTLAGTWELRAISHPADVHSKLLDTTRKVAHHMDPSTLLEK